MRKTAYYIFILFLTLGLGYACTGAAEQQADENTVDSQKVQVDSLIIQAQVDSLTGSVDSLAANVQCLAENVSKLDEDLFMTKSLTITLIVLNIILGYIVYKRIKPKRIDAKNESNIQVGPKSVRSVSASEPVESTVPEVKSKKETYTSPIVENKQQQPEKEVVVTVSPEIKRDPPKMKVVKFGAFLVDENGGIRTEQRVLTDESTNQLFRIEYEDGSDVATYTINPNGRASILADIQTFQNFTEKFTVTGAPTDVSVEQVGQLRKSGRSWIVTKKLKVSFK